MRSRRPALPEEPRGRGECTIGVGQHAGICLEDVPATGVLLQLRRYAGCSQRRMQPTGIVQQQFILANLNQGRRQATQVRPDR